MQGEQAEIRADDRADVQGFDNLQTKAEIAEFEAWLDAGCPDQFVSDDEVTIVPEQGPLWKRP